MVIDDMKKAIHQRDFSHFRRDAPFPWQTKPVQWYQCSRLDTDLSYEDLIKILNDRLGSDPIKIGAHPKYLYSGLMTIETTGWRGEFPFIDFRFNGFLLKEISECAERLPDLDSESRGDKIPPQVGTLLHALEQKNMRLLRPLVPNRRTYWWDYCGPGHSVAQTLYFDDLVSRLNDRLGSDRISFPLDVKVERRWDDILYAAFVDTAGWHGTEKYLSFEFILLKTTGRWELAGACHSEHPSAEFR